jgi:hypothetical protein
MEEMDHMKIQLPKKWPEMVVKQPLKTLHQFPKKRGQLLLDSDPLISSLEDL